MSVVSLRARLRGRGWDALEFLPVVSTLFALVLVAAAAVAWAGSPYDGMTWSTPGYVVLTVSSGSPAEAAGIRPGDQMLAIDGVHPVLRHPLYGPLRPGEVVDVTVLRRGETLHALMLLGESPLTFRLLRLCNLAVAIFLSTLSFAFSIGQRRSTTSVSFLLLYQLLAVIIAAGSVSALQLEWAMRTLGMAVGLMVPTAVHMASSFPVMRRDRWLLLLRPVLVPVGLLLALPYALLPLTALYQEPRVYRGGDITPLALLAAVLLSLALVAQSFRRERDREARAAIRISVLGLTVAVLPFVALYLFPRVLMGRGFISAEIAMLSLAALPLYHGFGMTRRRFSFLETALPALSSVVISGVIFMAVLLLSMWVMRLAWPGGGETALFAGVLIGAGFLAATNVRVISGARRMVHHAFFGQAYDYQSIVSDLSRDLAQAVGREELGKLVVDTLCRRMNLDGAALLRLDDAGQALVPEAASGAPCASLQDLSLGLDGALVRLLAEEGRPIRREALRERLARAPLTAAEAAVVDDESIALWAPVQVRGSLRGTVVLGNKIKDALFSRDDLAIAATLVRQIGVSMENADLYDSLRGEMRKLQEMQDQLVQAEKLSAVGELVSGVAHELNNPLTAVIGYAELLRAEIVDEQARKDIENILRSAERSRRIVRNLLTFARRQKAERRMVDLNELLQQTIEIQAYQMRVDNITVETDYDPHLPATAADWAQLQQVFLNIIMNAHQAIHAIKDRGRIAVKTRYVEDAIRITIADDGPGIPAEVMSRVFDPFFTTKEVGVGTGLGLSICYGIISSHGGRIWGESEPGRGASFHVELPVVRMRAVEPVEVETEIKTKAALRVLVVEDESAVSAVLQRLLTKKGCVAEAASSGTEALKLLQTRDYDMIISDIKMPGMGGIALWEALKSTRPHLATRVIFVTGDTASMQTSEFLRSAGQPVLPKPFGIEELARAINQLQSQAVPTRTP